MPEVQLIPVAKGAEYLEVHPTALAGHKAVGWVECEKREVEPPAGSGKPSDGLNVEQLKAALADKNVTIPDGVTKKADLAALLDSQPAE